MHEPEERASDALRRLVDGYQASQAIHVAATLGVADLLVDGPRASEELAEACGADPAALYRLLRALATLGVLREQPGRRFALTALGEPLRSDAPEPVGGWAAYVGRPSHWRAWGDLLHSVRTGENAFRHAHGSEVWEYRAARPEEEAVFDRAMTDGSLAANESLLDAYDFARFAAVVDVGGGRGAFLAALLARHSEARGILFDQPRVVAGAEELLEATGTADRCRLEGGSFFESVPRGGDAYVLQAVLHDWEDEQALAILRTCRRAVPDAGVLIVIERELGGPNEDREAKFSDLNMLVGPGGKERSLEEYGALFAQSGFRTAGATRTWTGLDIIEATPA